MTASTSRPIRWFAACLLAGASLPLLAQSMAALVHKPSVAVHSAPDFGSSTLATLEKDASLQVAGQEGLWFKVQLADGSEGYVRVTDVRMAYAGKEGGDANVRALFTGRAGKGRVTETAGVRGLDESSLQSAAFDGDQLAALEAYRATPEDAEAHARSLGWVAVELPWAQERTTEKKGGATQKAKRTGFGIARGLLGLVGGSSQLGDSALNVAEKSMGKSEEEMSAEELALGPAIAGRILGAAPLLDDPDAQRRVNLIGRWMASHTTRPEL